MRSILQTFDELTPAGRLRRLHRLARAVLERYEISVAACGLAAAETNLIYRVTATSGTRYALRIATTNWRTEMDLHSEAAWLEALARDTGIPAPRVVRTGDGLPYVSVEADGVPGRRRALLTSWLPGRVLTRCPSAATAAAMGELFARLHRHGAAWEPPAGFTTRIFDRVFSRDEPQVLFAPEQEDAYTPAVRRALEQAWERADRAYRDLPEDDRRVIHCDLWHGNLKLHRGVLHPFDFEDTVWGYRLHDLAMGLLDLAEDFGVERYEALLPAVRAGYERHLPWPEGDLAALQMGRVIWRLNWIARHQRRWLAEEAEFCAGLFARVARSGRLSDPLRA